MSQASDDDEQFEAFLRGEGELARALKELPQPTPGADLDQAILARARRELAADAAANDARTPAPDAPPAQHFLRRARAPLALAASVVLAVSLGLQWRPPAPQAPALQETPAAPKPLPPAAPAVPPATVDLPELPRAVPDAAPSPAVIAVQEPPPAAPAAAAPAVPALDVVAPPPPPAMAAAPAPAAPVAREAADATNVQVSGRRSRVASPPAADARAQAWIDTIDELLKEDLPGDALEQWKNFRSEFPDYPVPAALAEKMTAIESRRDAGQR